MTPAVSAHIIHNSQSANPAVATDCRSKEQTSHLLRHSRPDQHLQSHPGSAFVEDSSLERNWPTSASYGIPDWDQYKICESNWTRISPFAVVKEIAQTIGTTFLKQVHLITNVSANVADD